MVDFTNPDARTWAKNIIKNNMLTEGRAVGWMADFAEYTPKNVKLSSWNKWSGTYHNEYPAEWAKINQEAIEEFGSTNETVYFMRSGSTTSPKNTRLYWLGDQLPTLDRYDGLHSALIGILNGGVSGYSLCHSDIGGYTIVNMP
jgi:alpha-glucosidase